jgi:hypothetical protein
MDDETLGEIAGRYGMEVIGPVDYEAITLTRTKTLADRLYVRLISDRGGDPSALPGDAGDHVADSALRTVAALTLTKIGDSVVDAKTVLAWLLGSIGAPAALTGLLVPIRESGALLPQVAVARVVADHARRTPAWLVGAIGQAVAVAAMAVIAATMEGVAGGLALLAALAVFAVSRSVCSLTIKDVMGRTIPTGERGQVTGWSTTASGLVAITVGLGIRALGEDAGTAVFAALLAGAAVMWLASAAIFTGIREPAVEEQGVGGDGIWASLQLLRTDQPFRRFVISRTLLLVSALTPPFIVVRAAEASGASINDLGPFLVAAGLASLIGGRLWGPLADRSSRRLIAAASGTASVIALVFLGLSQVPVLAETPWWYVGVYLLLALVHQGARLGRATYIVDLGDGGGRTDYVAVSNTAIGVLLLAVGAISSAVALFGTGRAIVLLSVAGLIGVPVSLSMPEVGRGARG